MAKGAKNSKTTGSKRPSTGKKTPARDAAQLTVDRKKTKYKPSGDKLIHQILPYLFGVFAVFFVVCFVLSQFEATREYVSPIGPMVSWFFFGLVGWSAFALPVLLFALAIKWKKYVESDTAVSKTVFPILFVSTLSAFIHVVVRHFSGREASFDFVQIWNDGTELVGGGIIGGYLGEIVYAGLNIVGSIIILFPLVIMFFIFSIGMTPSEMWEFICRKYREYSERSVEKKAIKNEEKQIAREERAEALMLQRQENERLRLEREAKEKQEREKRIAEAEKRALELEKQAHRAERRAPAEPNPVVAEEAAEQFEPEMKPLIVNPIAEEAPEPEDDGKIDLEQIFSNPPKDFSKNIKNPLVDDEVEEAGLEIELKPITDIEGVPDDGIESQYADVPAFAEYQFPPVGLLKESKDEENEEEAHKELMENAQHLMETLKSFNVRIQEINYSRGPTITRYELKPDVGVRIRSIANLVDDIALSLATTGVRIEAPIPNKAAVGVEVPNKHAAVVSLRSLVDTTEFSEKKSKLTACLGKDVGGNPIFFDVGKMPHMLIAGTTGSGKSVCINCIIMSLLYKSSPSDLKLILIDPKKVEFNIYKSIPHLYCPIVSEPKKAAGALASAVAEMERRFELIEEVGARDIAGYNAVTADDPTKEHLPYMVIIIDELADLMMTAPDDVETAICRIAQKARAAGIHLIVGTQRPSTDVITGLIKSNIPSRIAFAVASQVDSRTILDGAGAEKLIGRGDMLFSPIGVTKPLRVQGAFVSDGEVEKIVDFLKENNDTAQFDDAFMRRMEEEAAKCGNKKGSAAVSLDDGEEGEEGSDPKFRAAVDVAIEMGKISTSLLQRRLEIGYGRAAKIIDRMEALGYVSAPDGNKPRQVLVTKMDIMEKRVNDDDM